MLKIFHSIIGKVKNRSRLGKTHKLSGQAFSSTHPNTEESSVVLLVLIMLECCGNWALSYKLTASCGWAHVSAYYCYSTTVHSNRGAY